MSKIIGLDVSKDWLDICIYTSQGHPVHNRYPNNKSGHIKLTNFIKDEQIKLIVCEPTGGYELEICKELSNKYPICRVNTYSFSLFSKSINLSKTDKGDAFKLVYYGERMELKVNYSYFEDKESLKGYQQQREDLVGILGNEKKRLHNSITGIDKESVDRYIKYLEEEITEIDSKLNGIIECSGELKKSRNIRNYSWNW